MSKLVLASSSPFRKEVLSRLGIPFDTISPDADETMLADESPSALVVRLAKLKAEAVASDYSDALIIGSDQVAALDGNILGKPGNHEKAVQQLQQASGRSVMFYTGLCLLNSKTGITQTDYSIFTVNFRKLNAEQIENYLQKEKPYNCAGSFKSEALGSALFDSLDGNDPTSLIGLPLIKLIRMLENEGVRVI